MCACKGKGELLGTAPPPPPPPPPPSSSVLTSCSGRFPPFFRRSALHWRGGEARRVGPPNVCVRVFLCAHNESVRSITLPLPLSSSLCVRKCALPFPPATSRERGVVSRTYSMSCGSVGIFYLASNEGEMILKHSYAPPIDPPTEQSRYLRFVRTERHDLDQCVVVVALFCVPRVQDE